VRNIMKCAAVLSAMLASASAIAGWEPTKPVEIVVAAGAGGAADQMARMMQAAIQKNNLMKQPMVVSLKGGASGAEALMYMKSSEGDANKVMIAYSLIYMLPLFGEDTLQLARVDAGVGGRAGQVRAVGQCRGAEKRKGIHRGCEGCQFAIQDGRHRFEARGSRFLIGTADPPCSASISSAVRIVGNSSAPMMAVSRASGVTS
jgi:hypothetical protein